MSGSSPTIGLGLMCKPPRPGATKTRLAASIGAETAARLSRAFLEDCASAAIPAIDAAALAPVAFYRPDDAAAELSKILGPRWPLVFADAGDLGATMLLALRHLLAASPGGAMIFGADVPLLDAQAMSDAAQVLRQGHDKTVVIIPSFDGGYCLIGIRSVVAAAPVFEPMAWSTQTVLSETLHRIEVHGLSAIVLPAQRDIDDIADLRWLQSELRAQRHACPATRAALVVAHEALHMVASHE